MPDFWTVNDIAEHLGITIDSARKQLSRWNIAPTARQPGRTGKNLYDPAPILAAHRSRPGQGARTDLKEHAMTTTTQLLGYAAYARVARVEDTVADYLGEFADDYDVEGLTSAFRAAINAELDGTGISLHGDDFYSTYPAPEDSAELIDAALERVDLGALAAEYDLTAQ